MRPTEADKAVRQAENFACEISYEIDQNGDCFREEDELYKIIGKIRKLEYLVTKAYIEVKEDQNERADRAAKGKTNEAYKRNF